MLNITAVNGRLKIIDILLNHYPSINIPFNFCFFPKKLPPYDNLCGCQLRKLVRHKPPPPSHSSLYLHT